MMSASFHFSVDMNSDNKGGPHKQNEKHSAVPGYKYARVGLYGLPTGRNRNNHL